MQHIRLALTTLAPLCHGSFSGGTGNAVTIRREPLVSIPGMPRVPCLSGNSIRGQVRRYLFRDLFHRAGLGVGKLPGKQWDLLYGALANGGHLTGNEKTPSPEVLREIRAALPPLSMLGAALYNYLLQGRCRFGFVWPVCLETVEAGLVSTEDGQPVPAAGDIVTETGMVRHVDRDQQDPAETGVTPMPVTVEAIATGVELQADIAISAEATDVERGALAFGLDQIGAAGGKSGSGFGAVRVDHDGKAAPYLAWLEEVGAEALKQRLVSFSETLS